jgi:predicted XRE-type DNA-binding protein
MKRGASRSQVKPSARAANAVSRSGVEASSGNVFADLGVSKHEEAWAKAELARKIGLLIAERKLTQAAAASLLGIDQPKISALLRGRLQGFSSDRLFRFLNALGSDVEIVVRPARERLPRIRIKAS